MLRIPVVYILLLWLLPIGVTAQNFEFRTNQNKQSLSFKAVKNLIVIPLFVNGKGPYDFVLDTGVGPMIVTDPSILDSLNFESMRKIKIVGMGLESVEAFITQDIDASIGNAVIKGIPTAILREDLFNLSGYLGMKIYGLIGYNFFNSFIVDIRYSESRIIFHNPDEPVKYKGSKVFIQIDNLKPYVVAKVQLPNGKMIDSRLLMDTGASHALSMETLNGAVFPLPDPSIKSGLGMSISGKINGHLGRIRKLQLGTYMLNHVVSGFPDYQVLSQRIDIKSRNGNLGADLLRRFNIQLNYQDGFMYLKPNSSYKKPFEHDMVGMTVYLDGQTYKRLLIGEVDEASPAEKAGLCPDDEIVGINFKSIDLFNLNDIAELFKSGTGRNIIFEVYRDKKFYFKVVRLEKRI